MNRLTSAGFFTLCLAFFARLPASADEPVPAASRALIPVVAAAPATSVQAHRRAKAPADEYFGRLKLSILGVRNVINEIDARADNAAEDVATGLCHRLVLAEDALRDWQSKYPDDAWIPKLGYAMLKDYEKIDTDIIADDSHIASVHAVDLAAWLDVVYPESEFAPK